MKGYEKKAFIADLRLLVKNVYHINNMIYEEDKQVSKSKLLECAVAQLVSVSASDTNSKVRSSNPAGNKRKFFDWKIQF